MISHLSELRLYMDCHLQKVISCSLVCGEFESELLYLKNSGYWFCCSSLVLVLCARVPFSSPIRFISIHSIVFEMAVKLWSDRRERDMYDKFAELFAIIKAAEKLEKAYVRDVVAPPDYESECQNLIAQFKTRSSTLKDIAPSIEHLIDTHKMDCPAGINRLVTLGVPASVEHRAVAATSAAVVVVCVHSLKLKMKDLSASLNKLSILPPDFEGTVTMREWVSRLSKTGAAEELTELEAPHLNFDLESSYSLFVAALHTAGT